MNARNMPRAQGAVPVEDHANRALRRFLDAAGHVLRHLAQEGAVLAVAADLETAAILKSAGKGAPERLATVPAEVVAGLIGRDWVRRRRSTGKVTLYELSDAGRAAFRRAEAMRSGTGTPMAENPFAEQHRDWESRWEMEPGSEEPRAFRANSAESPLTLLARRRERDGTAFLSPEQVQAGERLREDFELAQMGPRVAQNWDRFLTAGTSPGGTRPEPGGGARAARARVAEALAELGPGLGDIVLRCCCHLEGLEAAERRMGWSARSGKIVLRIALERLRRHYETRHGTLSPPIG